MYVLSPAAKRFKAMQDRFDAARDRGARVQARIQRELDQTSKGDGR